MVELWIEAYEKNVDPKASKGFVQGHNLWNTLFLVYDSGINLLEYADKHVVVGRQRFSILASCEGFCV